MSKKQWVKIVVDTDPALIESISDFLVGVIEAGVEMAAPDEPDHGKLIAIVERPNLGAEEVRVISAQLSDYIKEMAEIFSVPVPSFSITSIGEEDWGKQWKSFFKPFSIVPGLVIIPTWEQYTLQEGEKAIVMDPGMAFGTGHHATTCLTLQFIQETLESKPGATLLDVGTGTGILGMAGLLFGASEVLGIDNDADAVAAAEENVQHNNLHTRMKVASHSVTTIDKCYDIVVANIVHDVLVEMAEVLGKLTARNGYLILSGILAGEQIENIKAVFSLQGFAVKKVRQKEEWSAVLFAKG